MNICSWIPSRALPHIAAAGMLGSLAACSTYRDIPPNAPIQHVEAVMGQPTHRCPHPDGSENLVWSQQPLGQYSYSAFKQADGTVREVYNSYAQQNLKRLVSETWPRERVLCEFGPPARVSNAGLGEKREVVWSYHIKQDNVWNSLLHLYMGPEGQQLTHYGIGIDPRYERSFFQD